MADLLLEKGYEVYGLVRRSATPNHWRIAHIKDRITLIEGDLSDDESLHRAIAQLPGQMGENLSKSGIHIDAYKTELEVYNFAANSFVGNSWDNPINHMDVNALGVIRLLNAVRRLRPDAKVYLAGSSEQFGKVQETPQKESTPFYPRSPYGVAKVAQYWTGVNYRESYNMFICCGLLFNHESARRTDCFVTQKIVKGMRARVPFQLGNIDSKRDWGHAKDYVRGAYLMLQQDEPDDFVLATGETHSVRDFVETTMKFHYPPAKWEWKGEGLDEVGGYITKNGFQPKITISEEFYRPAEVDLLLGDATKAKKILGWEPEYTFEALVEEMMNAV